MVVLENLVVSSYECNACRWIGPEESLDDNSLGDPCCPDCKGIDITELDEEAKDEARPERCVFRYRD